MSPYEKFHETESRRLQALQEIDWIVASDAVLHGNFKLCPEALDAVRVGPEANRGLHPLLLSAAKEAWSWYVGTYPYRPREVPVKTLLKAKGFYPFWKKASKNALNTHYSLTKEVEYLDGIQKQLAPEAAPLIPDGGHDPVVVATPRLRQHSSPKGGYNSYEKVKAVELIIQLRDIGIKSSRLLKMGSPGKEGDVQYFVLSRMKNRNDLRIIQLLGLPDLASTDSHRFAHLCKIYDTNPTHFLDNPVDVVIFTASQSSYDSLDKRFVSLLDTEISKFSEALETV